MLEKMASEHAIPKVFRAARTFIASTSLPHAGRGAMTGKGPAFYRRGLSRSLNFDGGTGELCRVGHAPRRDSDCFCRRGLWSDIVSTLRNGAGTGIRRINMPGHRGI